MNGLKRVAVIIASILLCYLWVRTWYPTDTLQSTRETAISEFDW